MAEEPVEIDAEEHEQIVERVAAIDVAKASGELCTRVPHASIPGKRVTKVWSVAATTNAITALAEQLARERIERVVVESTSDYWRPFVYLLQARGLTVWLVNARDVKQVPGRPKTDKLDSVWLAKLNERGMLRPSFVPPAEIRRLRDYTRLRLDLTEERSRHAQRLEKLLEDALIKLSSVASDILGVSGRAMMTALIAGERDPQVLAEMAKARMRPKIPQLVQALTGNFGEHHAFLCRLHLQRIDQLTAAIGELSARIEEQMRPFAHQLERLSTIPGVGQAVAEVIIAETGADMSRFPTAAHLASWAGVCPGQHESAGKRRSGKTRHGDRWLTGTLGTAAMAAARTKDTTYLGARYQRLARRLGKKKALVAVQHSILIAIWHMLANDVDYADLGGHYFARLDPDLAMRRIVRQANALGFTVRFDPIQAA